MTSLSKRLEAFEAKIGDGEELVTLMLGDQGPYLTTRSEIDRVVRAAQGTYLKPVTMGAELLPDETI